MNRTIPSGVAVGDLGRRCGAALIDAAPIALVVVAGLILSGQDGAGPSSAMIVIISAALLGTYALYQWWAYGVHGAGIGARLVGLRLVGIGDGQPIGWWRWLVRQLVFLALVGSVVGGILLVVFLVIQERRQGWHDMAARAIIVQPMPMPNPEPSARSSSSDLPSSSAKASSTACAQLQSLCLYATARSARFSRFFISMMMLTYFFLNVFPLIIRYLHPLANRYTYGISRNGCSHCRCAGFRIACSGGRRIQADSSPTVARESRAASSG